MSVALLLPLVLLARVHAPVQVVHKPYKGWSDAYWISNDTVELVVVPSIGRVMRYAQINDLSHKNLLWENASIAPTAIAQPGQWMNFGGDKEWIAPQTTDSWPPSPQIDPGPWSCGVLPNGITMTSRQVPGRKLVISRVITLADTGSKVSFTNNLKNNGDMPQKACPWQVTQVDNPEAVIIGYRMTDSQQAGYYDYGYARDPKHFERKGDTIILNRDPQKSRKYGAYALNGEIQAIEGATVFHMVQKVTPGAAYPDHDSPQQVYMSADPLAYGELEQVGFLASLETGEVTIQKVEWYLTNRTR